jgi:DNA-binding winged helix-turn-helix (wHTH) protein/Flp pilus assembly protein TadD
MTDVTFGPFSFDPASTRLLRGTAEIKLRPQARRALRVLLRHRGRPIGYEQMIAEAWEGTHVSPHTIDVTVAEVKKSLGEYGQWIIRRPREGYALEIPTSEELVRKGWHFWSRRTREGFERAIACFQQAVAECPSDFQAHHGLSVCYLMLATFGMRPPRQMYPLFQAAHDRAAALGGLTPELRCNRAYALLIFERRLKEAEDDLRRTIEEQPTLASAYVRSALVYASAGRLDDAHAVVERGFQVDPLFPLLSVTAMAVRFWKRDYEGAVALAAKAVELHPYLQVGRAFYAQALEFAGRLDAARAQYQIGWLMSQDLPWMLALEGTCLAKMERMDDARRIVDSLEQLRRSEYVDAYYMAVLRAAVGDRQEAFREVERAFDDNSAWLYQIDIDSKMDTFRGDPRFERLRRTLAGRRASG